MTAPSTMPAPPELPTGDDLTMVVIAKLSALDERLRVVEESGIWKAIHDSNGGILRLADSYERMVDLVDEALRAVRQNGAIVERLNHIDAEILLLKKSGRVTGT